jgi:ribonucleoside-triphosphate reductase
MELAIRYGVRQAPTLVVVAGDDYKKYAGAPAIKNYVQDQPVGATA